MPENKKEDINQALSKNDTVALLNLINTMQPDDLEVTFSNNQQLLQRCMQLVSHPTLEHVNTYGMQAKPHLDIKPMPPQARASLLKRVDQEQVLQQRLRAERHYELTYSAVIRKIQRLEFTPTYTYTPPELKLPTPGA